MSLKPSLKLSLKLKLTLILSLLLVSNAAYFYAGVGTIDRMDEIARTLYDRVVMSGTYAQMVKNDFHRYSNLLTSRLIEADAAAQTELDQQIDETSQTLVDDVGVVRERALSAEDQAALVDLEHDFAMLDAGRAARIKSDGSPLRRVAQWQSEPARVALLSKVSDLADQIVARGYDYRLKSVERAAHIRRVSVLGSVFILLLNALAFGFILVSILPRLRRLTQVCGDIARGQYATRVTFAARDEFGELADAFNTMLEALRRSEDRVATQLRTTNVMMDGLGQGFLMIGADGICLPVFSKACVDLLGGAPGGQPAWRALGVPEDDVPSFTDWLSLMFRDVSDFESLTALGPDHYPHVDGRVVALTYKPLRDESGQLQQVVVVATERTAEVNARDEATREQDFSRMVVKLLRHRDEFTRFLLEAKRMIESVPTAPTEEAMRALHTLKGGAATYSLMGLKQAAHDWETRLATPDEHVSRGHARISLLQTYDEVIDLLRTQCAFELGAIDQRRDAPLSEVLEPFAEVIHDLGVTLGKRVRPLVIEGGDLLIDRAVYGDLVSSLVHVFRNAVDHGIESADERERQGKDPFATIRAAAEPTVDGGLRITIDDDGRGIDVARLREALGRRGIDVTHEDEQTLIQRIFDPQVSTASHVTEISGRGVGLDAVRAAARALGGEACVRSRAGEGTTIEVRLPGRRASAAA